MHGLPVPGVRRVEHDNAALDLRGTALEFVPRRDDEAVGFDSADRRRHAAAEAEDDQRPLHGVEQFQ